MSYNGSTRASQARSVGSIPITRSSILGVSSIQKTFSQKIIEWFDDHGRKELPWQNDPSSYRVWISEIMLQQTQVTTVIPYFQRFMDRFPTVSKLARAPVDEVLKYWAGLGYYSRARNLHKTSEIIHAQYQGVFPEDLESLMALPGIGRSTAGAILALSQNKPVAILDGNVKRVLCRYFALPGDPTLPAVEKELWKKAESLMPQKKAKEYTQAMMDLGALICTRSSPKCDLCPLQGECVAFKKNQTTEFPHKKAQKEKPTQSQTFLLLVSQKNRKVLLEKRPPKGIWGGLFCLPIYNDEEVLQSSNNKSQNSVKSRINKMVKNEIKKQNNRIQSKNIEIRFPNFDQLKKYCKSHFQLKLESQCNLTSFRHTFTHYHLIIHPILCLVSEFKESLKKSLKAKDFLPSDYFYWHTLSRPLEVGLPTPIQSLVKALSEDDFFENFFKEEPTCHDLSIA